MIRVNLLPKDDGRRSGTSIPTPVAISSIAGVTLVAALLGLLFVSAHGTVKSRRLERTNREIAERLDAAIGTIRSVLDAGEGT